MRARNAKSRFNFVGARARFAAVFISLSLVGAFWMVQARSLLSRSDKQGQPTIKPITTTGINIVDQSGQTRITLSAKNGSPLVLLLDASGAEKLSVSLDQAGFSSIKLKNPNMTGPVATFEIDGKGAHVKFDKTGGASSYLFLNNSGESGAVFLDARGARKLDLLVTPEGATEIHRFDRQPSSVPK